MPKHPFALALLFLGAGVFSSCSSKKTLVRNNASVSEARLIEAQAHFFDGLKEKTLGNWATAKAEFQQVVNLDGKNAAAAYELARILLSENQFANAESLAIRANELDPSNVWYFGLLAEVYQKQGKIAECAKTLERLLLIQPNEYDTYYELSLLYGQMMQFDKALSAIERLEQKAGISQEILAQKIEILEAMGKKAEAVQKVSDYRKSQELSAENLFFCGELFISLQQLSEAKACYEAALKLDKSNSKALLGLADVARMEKNKPEMKVNMEKAFQDASLPIDLKIRMLVELISDAQMDTTLYPLLESLGSLSAQVHPNEAKSFSVLGDIYSLLRKPEEAVNAYKKAIQLDTGNQKYLIWQQLLLHLSDLKRWSDLRDESIKALELFPSLPIPYYMKGLAHYMEHEWDPAANSLKNGLMFVSGEKSLELQFLSLLGETYHEMGKHAESDKTYDQILEKDPNNPAVLNNYAYYLSLRKQRLDKAQEMSKRSNELSPANANYLDTYAWIFFQKDNFSEARTWMEKAMKVGEPSATVLEHYGDILFKLNEPEKAMEYWEKAKTLATPSATLLRKIADKRWYE